MATPRTMTPEEVQALRNGSGVSGVPRTLTPEQVAQAQGKPYTPALKTDTQFVNQADQDMYQQKQAKYDAINQRARQDRESGNAYQDIGTAASRGLEGRVAETGTGLRRLFAKATNRLGFSDSLDPNSPDYNPILDRKSATSQLAKEQYFKVPKGTPGKAWATAYDVTSMAAPSAAASLLPKASALSTGLGMLSGDTKAGQALVKGMSGVDVAEMAGFGGKLARTATSLASNLTGGLAQTGIREGGLDGKDFGDVLKGSLISHGLFDTLPGLYSGARKFFKPSLWAKEVMDEVVAKYDGSLERALQESPRLREVMEKSSDFINQSTTEGFKKSNFSKTEFGQKAQAAANLHITTNLLSDLKTKYGGKTDSATAYQANQDYLGVLSKIRDKVISMISRAVPKSEMTHYRDIMDEAYDMSYKKGDRPAAALRAKEILQDILDRKARANGIKTERGKLSIKQITSLLKETADVEFDENLTSEESRAVATLMHNFRKLSQDEVHIAAENAGLGELGEQYKIINGEMFNGINAEKILDNISKNPATASAFTNHMFGLLTGSLTGNPLLYTPGRILSTLANDSLSDLRFANITNNPILGEIGKRRMNTLSGKLGKAFEKANTVTKSTAKERGKRKASDLYGEFFNPTASKPTPKKPVNTDTKKKLSDIVKNKKK